MQISLATVALTLFLAIDAFGIIPEYLALMHNIPQKKQRRVIVRELIFALIVMVLFYYVGSLILDLLGLTSSTIQIAGGIVIFLVALRLIFQEENLVEGWKGNNPFIVPIATPLIAGPSVLAIIMIYSQEALSATTILGGIFLSWLCASIILFCATPIFKIMGEKGLAACQKLMGLLVGLIAVQMFLQGLKVLIGH